MARAQAVVWFLVAAAAFLFLLLFALPATPIMPSGDEGRLPIPSCP